MLLLLLLHVLPTVVAANREGAAEVEKGIEPKGNESEDDAKGLNAAVEVGIGVEPKDIVSNATEVPALPKVDSQLPC
jgi:hypothetical protein